MAVVYLGLGSNLGEREANIRAGLKCLGEGNIAVEKVSDLIETEPEGGPPDQGKYLNAVAKAVTALAPLEFLHTVKAIEKKLGRTPAERNAARVIDIDILLYDDLAYQSPELTIPHPAMLTRDFVLRPLREIAPEKAKELLDAHRHGR